MTNTQQLKDLDAQLRDYASQAFHWNGPNSCSAIKILASIVWFRAHIMPVHMIPETRIDENGILGFYWDLRDDRVDLKFYDDGDARISRIDKNSDEQWDYCQVSEMTEDWVMAFLKG